ALVHSAGGGVGAVWAGRGDVAALLEALARPGGLSQCWWWRGVRCGLGVAAWLLSQGLPA
ncbi:unnamed protein product, partial [Closterium sp. Naga37s-1]